MPSECAAVLVWTFGSGASLEFGFWSLELSHGFPGSTSASDCERGRFGPSHWRRSAAKNAQARRYHTASGPAARARAPYADVARSLRRAELEKLSVPPPPPSPPHTLHASHFPP